MLYAGTGEGNFSQDSYYGNGILKTTDGGETWKNYARDIFKLARFSRLVISPRTTTTIFAAIASSEHPDTAAGIYRSVDAGEHWERLEKDLPSKRVPATDIVLDPVNPNVAYAAFLGVGIFMTNNADDSIPSWGKLNTGLPETNDSLNRIALAISPSSPKTLYALVVSGSRPYNKDDEPDPNDPDKEFYVIDRFYVSRNAGSTWTRVKLPGLGTKTTPWEKDSIGGNGWYNLNIAVSPTTPDIVYLSSVSLWKAVRNPTTDNWIIKDIGKPIHPDNHAFAFDPINSSVIYAGNDGGIYKSNDGGDTWSDVINKGLCTTQFEYMEQHPNSDAVILAGTQDNGTVQFRNSSAFNICAGGDGGFVDIDQDQPNVVFHEYYNPTPERSVDGGSHWKDISKGLSGNSLFYPPFTLDRSHTTNIAFGTDKVYLDTNQGLSGWNAPGSPIELPNLDDNEVISAIKYIKSDLIYLGTTNGKVFRLTKTNNRWAKSAIHDPSLQPTHWIWDIATYPNDVNSIIVTMGGFGSVTDPNSHVWRGIISENEKANWQDINPRNKEGELIDIPVNAIVIYPEESDTLYIGTDIGVFRTINGGKDWVPFSEGLPNSPVFDMRLQYLQYTSMRLLRVATHGRGIWERRLDVKTTSDVDIFLRDHLLDTGRSQPSVRENGMSYVAASFEDSLRQVKLGDELSWSMCADIKIDALEGSPPHYQIPEMDDVDYVKFERELVHHNAQRGRINRIYVQVHNRGIKSAKDVTVKILYAEGSISRGYPDLPTDFWKVFPDNSSLVHHTLASDN